MVSTTLMLTAASLFFSAACAPATSPLYTLQKHPHEEGFVFRAASQDGFAAPRRNHPRSKGAVAKRCAHRSFSTPLSSPTGAPGGVGASPTTTPTTTTSSSRYGGGGGDGDDNDQKPYGWPTKTQSGPTYSATRASSSDPYLLGVSEALNFKSVKDYNTEHTGDMTYYITGQTSCGDFYTDDSYTAAVSHELYDDWPQSNGPTDRAAICGPYVPGREIINSQGKFSPAIDSQDGSIIIGGDGFPNCRSSVGLKGQCHIPLTITITNPANGKSAVVKLVDKCGGCPGRDDIDVTPAVFKYLSDPSLGRVRVTWKFNHF